MSMSISMLYLAITLYKSHPGFSPQIKSIAQSPLLQQSSASSWKFADMMIPHEIRGIRCLIPQDFNIFLPNDKNQNINTNTLSGTTHHHHHHQELNVVPSSSTSDEADEKKQRRMISNRESARRSRMRKKRHVEELRSLLVRLRSENHDLVQRLKHLSESHDMVLQENAKLREEASHLRQMVESSFAIALIDFDFDEPPSNCY